MATVNEFKDFLAKLSADVDAHVAKEVKTEADLADANAQIFDLKDKLAHAGMSDVEEADVLAELAALEEKLNPPATDPLPAPGPLPENGPN